MEKFTWQNTTRIKFFWNRANLFLFCCFVYFTTSHAIKKHLISFNEYKFLLGCWNDLAEMRISEIMFVWPWRMCLLSRCRKGSFISLESRTHRPFIRHVRILQSLEDHLYSCNDTKSGNVDDERFYYRFIVLFMMKSHKAAVDFI